MFDVKTASTKDLVAEYNRLTGKSITKFSDRATGEKQVTAALERAKMLASAKGLATAGREANAEAKAQAKPVEPAVADPVSPAPASEPVAAPAPKLQRQKKVKARIDPMLQLPVDRSAAIQRSWTNTAVAAARAQRTAVEVNAVGADKGEVRQFRSVKQAFEELGLPLGVHIPFRMTLKAQGKHKIEQDGVVYNFKTVKAAS